MRKIEEKSQLESKRNSCKKLPPKRNTLQHVPCPTAPIEHYQNKDAVTKVDSQTAKNHSSTGAVRVSGDIRTSMRPVLMEQSSQGFQSLDQVDESTSTYLSPSGSLSNENTSFNNYCKTIQYEQLNSKYSTRIYPATTDPRVNHFSNYRITANQHRHATILSNTKSYEAVFTFNQSTLI